MSSYPRAMTYHDLSRGFTDDIDDCVAAGAAVVVAFLRPSGEDPHLHHFMNHLSLFTFFMLLLVTADNFVQMFVGWEEGVGLCSYLSINFCFICIQANKAAIKAMVVNRIGDSGLALLGIFGIFICFGSVDYAYSIVFELFAPQLSSCTLSFLNIEFNALNLIGVLLSVGAVGKSAQLGLHTHVVI